MKIKAKINLTTLLLSFLTVVILVICIYFFVPFNNPRPFAIDEFLIWIISSILLGLLILFIYIILLTNVYLLVKDGILYYSGLFKLQKLEISNTSEINISEDSLNPVITIKSANTEIAFIGKYFNKVQLNEMLIFLLSNNLNIKSNEFTKAYLSNKESWILKTPTLIKIAHLAKFIFGYLILILIIIGILPQILNLSTIFSEMIGLEIIKNFSQYILRIN